MIIKLFQAKFLTRGELIKSDKLGQGNVLDSTSQTRATKTQATENLYNTRVPVFRN